ncbi:hypothetical protein AQJ23_07935 [Streptomyces antibioticus]|nr:hypothetical protein [Streptomyces antibioticus]KUN28844.1 hypothetical protein AQJ23_07935 [Streptomyces antibioticus]
MTTTTKHAATLHTRTDGRTYRPEHLSTDTARRLIRRARANRTGVAAVHVYECTDRDGNALHIAYVHYAPDHWSNVTDGIDIYEIPTAALTDL